MNIVRLAVTDVLKVFLLALSLGNYKKMLESVERVKAKYEKLNWVLLCFSRALLSPVSTLADGTYLSVSF